MPIAPEDRVLDRIPSVDPAREQYPFRSLVAVGEVTPVAKYWKEGAVLDQGYEGSCVGHGWTGDLLAAPRPDPYTDSETGHEYAVGVYNEAKTIDEWPGENYDGTSVNAGGKVIKNRGFITGFYWCNSVTQIRDAIITKGPVVIGIPWMEKMYYTRSSGLVEIGGDNVGGHCLVLTGYSPHRRIAGETGYFDNVYRWRNSWGTSYGNGGSGFILQDDLKALVFDSGEGEAAVAEGRSLVRLSS